MYTPHDRPCFTLQAILHFGSCHFFVVGLYTHLVVKLYWLPSTSLLSNPHVSTARLCSAWHHNFVTATCGATHFLLLCPPLRCLVVSKAQLFSSWIVVLKQTNLGRYPQNLCLRPDTFAQMSSLPQSGHFGTDVQSASNWTLGDGCPVCLKPDIMGRMSGLPTRHVTGDIH